MGRDYSCRSMCGFTGEGKIDPLKQLHDHYLDHPAHKITQHAARQLRKGYTVKSAVQVAAVAPKSKRTYKPRTNHSDTGSVRPLSAFEQLHNLMDAFNAEIATESETITKLHAEIDARRKRVGELMEVRDRLAGPAVETVPNPPTIVDAPSIADDESYMAPEPVADKYAVDAMQAGSWTDSGSQV